MSNILIVSGHPDLSTSIANQTILDEVATALPTAKIRKLDELYPTCQIDVQAEQEALLWADTIVLQFPFSWYSLPGLMKLWLDKVFTHNFAYGSQAKLGGKKLIISITAGAPDVVYQKDGFFGYTAKELFPQFENTAKWCNLDYQEPIFTAGINFLERGADEEKVNAHKAVAKDHAKRLIDTLNKLA